MVTIIDVNGAEMYAHTAWAESPDGDSFSTVEFDDADYIGTLIDRNAAEETDPTKYTWRYADAGMEEDEEDEDVTADLSSDLEELVDNVAEVADQINQQQVDFINTQNVTDGAIGNVNELNGTNNGVHGWTVPDGFRVSQSYEDVDANPDTDKVLVSTITRDTSGTDATVTFDATELVISLAGADAGNAYTISLQSRMSELFEIPVSVSKSDGTNVMLDFGVINNAVTVEPEEPEEEDAGTAEAAEEDPTVDEIIADEEGADDTPTGEIAGAGAWSWFESTAETASVTADAQELRFDLAEMPVGAELSIANLKIEAGAMATPWRRSIKEVAGIAAEAQSTADDAHAEAIMAQSTAAEAQSAANFAANAASAAHTKAEEAAIAAATAQTKADAASTAASTAQSSAATAAQAAATAQSTADAAKASASSAANAASAAQTKANEASSAAETAQSKADSAGTAASKAQSSANAAGEAASSAQAAAEAAQVAAGAAQADIDSHKEYFWHDANGAHVLGSKTAATRYRTDIDSEGMHIKDVSGEVQEVAKFTAEGVQIGKDGEAHQEINYNSWTFFGPGKWAIAAIKDQRDRTGYAKYSETVTAYSGRNYVTSTHTINKNEATATIEGEPVTVSSVKNKYTVYFEEVFTKDTQVTITYDTADQLSSFELGSLASATGAEAVAFGASRATGDSSLAFGLLNESSGKNSFSHGFCTIASGEESHAEGSNTIASGKDSHAEGENTIAAHWQQHVQGTYNDNLEEDAFEIGNGTSDTNRSNAFRVTKEGDVYSCGDIVPGKITGIANLIYPVGSIYMSTNATSPAMLFGGTWERIQDRFLLAAGSTYDAGKMDGSADAVVVRHSHGQSSHAHSPSDGEQYGFMEYKQGRVSRTKVKTDSSSAGRYAILGTSGASSAEESNLGFAHYTSFATPEISDSGVSGEGKNMPPYLTVYMWKRTA